MNDENGALSGLLQGAIKAKEDKLNEIEDAAIKVLKNVSNVKKKVSHEIPDLDETVSMMNAEDFDDRMRAEYWQMRIRRMKLERQMDKLANKVEQLDEIDEAQKEMAIQLMRQQLMTMKEYAEILIRRATLCGIDLCAGDAEGIAERCIMADKHRQEAHNLNGMAVQKW